MTKQRVVLYLEPQDKKLLESKAEASGFTGRGKIINFVEKICREPVLFIDDNIKKLGQVFSLTQNNK